MAKTSINAMQYSVLAFMEGRKKLFLVKYSKKKAEKTACPNKVYPSFHLLFIVAAIEIWGKDKFFSKIIHFLFSFDPQKEAPELPKTIKRMRIL